MAVLISTRQLLPPVPPFPIVAIHEPGGCNSPNQALACHHSPAQYRAARRKIPELDLRQPGDANSFTN